MLNWLRSLYGDWMQGPRTVPETGPGSDPSPPSEEPVGGTSAEESGRDRGAGDADPGAGDADPGSWGGPTSLRVILDEERVSKQAVRIELGLEPREFLAELVRHTGGRMWQTDIVETTGWSKSTVSRYLSSLESGDTVERIRIGRRKLVAVPGQMPDCVPDTGSSPAEPPAMDRSAATGEPI